MKKFTIKGETYTLNDQNIKDSLHQRKGLTNIE